MTIVKDRTEDTLVLLMEGRLDAMTAPQLQAELLPELDSVRQVRLDFKQVNYMFSAGLRVLLLAEKTAKTTGCKIVLVNVSPEVLDVFKMTGLMGILTIEQQP
jgi:anti-anti-sigma factor